MDMTVEAKKEIGKQETELTVSTSVNTSTATLGALKIALESLGFEWQEGSRTWLLQKDLFDKEGVRYARLEHVPYTERHLLIVTQKTECVNVDEISEELSRFATRIIRRAIFYLPIVGMVEQKVSAEVNDLKANLRECTDAVKELRKDVAWCRNQIGEPDLGLPIESTNLHEHVGKLQDRMREVDGRLNNVTTTLDDTNRTTQGLVKRMAIAEKVQNMLDNWNQSLEDRIEYPWWKFWYRKPERARKPEEVTPDGE